MAYQPTIYILSNIKNGTLYIGVTSNLIQRIWQHKSKVNQGFSNKYDLDKLVYYEIHTDIKDAILREKQLKKWRRQWKLNLINEQNPNWVDLWDNILS
jgi:putative endonuclease